MTQKKWILIIRAYRAGNKKAFNQSIIPYYYKIKRQIKNLEGFPKEEDCWLIFSDSMVKSRRLFLAGDKNIPQSINGYIYTMQKNIWADICRKRNQVRQIRLRPIEKEKLEFLSATGSDTSPVILTYNFQEAQNEEQKRLQALDRAISRLEDTTCKKIIEEHSLEGKKLKVLKKEINYRGTDQAIGGKKKRCIEKLTKLFFIELNQE